MKARLYNFDSASDVLMTIEIQEVRKRGFSWRLRTADQETAIESPVFPSLYQCLCDLRTSAVLNPGTDPYVRR